MAEGLRYDILDASRRPMLSHLAAWKDAFYLAVMVDHVKISFFGGVVLSRS
jgi:hypothetical protein